MRCLSAVALAVAIPTLGWADPCEIPAQYTHRAILVDGPTEVTIAAGKFHYLAGETVPLFLLIKNVGSTTLTIERANSPMDGFMCLPLECPALEVPGCDDEILWYTPQVLSPSTDTISLQPGECEARATEWNRISNFGPHTGDPVAGIVNLLGGLLDHVPARAFFLPRGGLGLQLTLEPLATIPTTWSQAKHLYR